ATRFRLHTGDGLQPGRGRRGPVSVCYRARSDAARRRSGEAISYKSAGGGDVGGGSAGEWQAGGGARRSRASGNGGWIPGELSAARGHSQGVRPTPTGGVDGGGHIGEADGSVTSAPCQKKGARKRAPLCVPEISRVSEDQLQSQLQIAILDSAILRGKGVSGGVVPFPAGRRHDGS